MYFSKFPKLNYDIKGDGNLSQFTHILKRVKLAVNASANTKVFDYYQVAMGEKPEDIAFKYYGDASLHWVVLIVNDVIDRFHQWPMGVEAFEQYLQDKYSNPNGIHHYEITKTSGDTSEVINIGPDKTSHPTAVSVSNYQFEEDVQVQRGQIRILKKDFLVQFIREFKALMSEGTG